MTARSSTRRRTTWIGAGLVVVLIAAAAVLAVVGANSVVTSTAGQTVVADDRPVVVLPDTDNAALAAVDADGRLASLAIATLLPTGRGGSIVTIPVNADINGGLEATARPLESIIDLDDPASFFQSVENTVGVTLRFGEIVSAERLAEVLEPVTPAEVDLATDLNDGLIDDATVVVPAGESELDADEAAAALAAVDQTVSTSATHRNDVAIWSAVAAEAGGPGNDAAGGDESGGDVATLDDLFTRLWSGEVQVRDLMVDDELSVDGDATVLSRPDTVLVFAQVSPTRLAAPEPGLIYRVVVPFSDEQIEATDGLFESNTDAARTVVGEMLFFQNNVISVDVTPAEGGADEVTRIEVAEAALVDGLQDSAFVIFGDAEAVAADEVVEGIDVVVTLGTAFFDVQIDGSADADSESLAGEGDDSDTVEAEGDDSD